MYIYLDLLFILNLWIDFLLLIITNMIMKYKVYYKRAFISSLIGALSTFLVFINNNLILIFLKIIICIIMQLIMNNYKGIKTLMENTFYFYFTSIILAGTMYLLNENSLTIRDRYLLLTILTPVILLLNKKQISKLDYYYKDIYEVVVIYKNKKYIFNALLDTGNNVYDQYKKRPISLVYSNKIKYNYEDIIFVPIETANNKSLLKCIKVDKLLVDGKVINNALIGFLDKKINIQDIDMILHKKIIGGKK